MNYRIITIILVVCCPLWIHAQNSNQENTSDWIINEVYVSEAPTRYGLFVELYHPSLTELPDNLFISTSKDNSDQYRLRKKWRYNPDQRQKKYWAFRVSTIRYKRRSIKIHDKPDTLYLFKMVNYESELKDSFPVLWSDSLSLGRCGNRICYFNIPTPGRKNKNVNPIQYIPRRGYRLSILGGSSTASNAGFDNGVGRIPSFTFKGQKFINRRLFYTTTSAAIYSQGYSFNSTENLPTKDGGTVTVKSDGYYFSVGTWIGKEIGIYLTPRFDLSTGAGIVAVSFTKQIYTQTINSVSSSQNQYIGNYPLPVLTFNSGLNYQLTPQIKIELLYTVLFRTFERSATTYYQSFNIGLSKHLSSKGRGYREGLLW